MKNGLDFLYGIFLMNSRGEKGYQEFMNCLNIKPKNYR